MIYRHLWAGERHNSFSAKQLNGNTIAVNLTNNPLADPGGPVLGLSNSTSSFHTNPYSMELPEKSPLGAQYGFTVDLVESNLTGALASVYNVDGLGNTETPRWLSCYVYANRTCIASIAPLDGAYVYVTIPPNTWMQIISEISGPGWGSLVAYRSGAASENPLEDRVYWTNLMVSTALEDFFSGDTQDYQIPKLKLRLGEGWVDFSDSYL